MNTEYENDAYLMLSHLSLNNAYKEYAHILRKSISRKYGLNDSDVDDVIQKTFLIAYRNMSKYDETSCSINTWIYGICIRVAADHIRTAYNRFEQPVSDIDIISIDHTPSPERHVENRQAIAALNKILDSLWPAWKKTAFIASVAKKMTNEKIHYDDLNTPQGTIYSRERIVLKEVKGRFEKRGRYLVGESCRPVTNHLPGISYLQDEAVTQSERPPIVPWWPSKWMAAGSVVLGSILFVIAVVMVRSPPGNSSRQNRGTGSLPASMIMSTAPVMMTESWADHEPTPAPSMCTIKPSVSASTVSP